MEKNSRHFLFDKKSTENIENSKSKLNVWRFQRTHTYTHNIYVVYVL